MSNIIDRRLNPRDKTIKNRQKFIERSRDQIKKSVKDAIDSGSIADIEDGKAKIKVKGVSEPEFGTDHKTGDKRYVMPGNKDFVVNDTQEKPKDGEGNAGGNEGGLGRGEDDFEFVLNKDEFLDFIFEDLELPDLAKKQMKDVTKVTMKRSGFTNVGNPSQLDVVRSLKNSMGRRIGLHRPKDEDIAELEEELKTATDARAAEILLEIEELKNRMLTVPWLDPFDVRYRNFTATPQPMTKAVMFCIMDVSASMGQREKDLAKRFFFFLHMFLHRKYEKVDIVFIRHHESADEVNEETFFNSKESGGTVVSSALQLTKSIIKARYNVADWNIYVAQASDGDNFGNDRALTEEAILSILPSTQHFAYVEISNTYSSANGGTDLWRTYVDIVKQFPQLNLKKVKEKQDIWTVFKALFTKETA